MRFFSGRNDARLLFLSATHAIACAWQEGKSTYSTQFVADEDGYQQFAQYLATSPDVPLYLIADIIEEDFRNETVPHVGAMERSEMLDRKLSQFFRGTEYRCARVQGREETGRRNDRVLFTALTNSDPLTPWVSRILASHSPLAGISSAPQLAEPLARALGHADAAHLLLVTNQQYSGLRQTYLQHGRLKFSRLTPFISLDEGGAPESMPEIMAEECRRTRQYLERQKLLPHDQVLEIQMYGDAAECELLRDGQLEEPLLLFNFQELEGVAARFGIDPDLCSSGMISLCLIRALSAGRPVNHYAPPLMLRYHRLRQLRFWGAVASVLFVVLGLVGGGVRTAAGLVDFTRQQRLRNETMQLEQQYEALRRDIPPGGLAAADMKQAVETVDGIRSHAIPPEQMMELVSRALATCPEIALQRLEWRLEAVAAGGEAGGLATGQAGGANPEAAAISGLLAAMQQGVVQVSTVIEGSVQPFASHWSAHEIIGRFSGILANDATLTVTPVEMPLSTSPAEETLAKLGAVDPNAKFVLKLVHRSAP